MGARKLLSIGVLALLPGCQLAYYATRNIINEPSQLVHNVSLTHKTRSQARQVYREYTNLHPEVADSHDFKAGFVDGYSDFLDNGGNGEPPAVPPLRYRSNKYFTPEGKAAIDQYFSGFVAGSRVAQESGLRDLLLVPVLVPATEDDTEIDPMPQPSTTAAPSAETQPLTEPKVPMTDPSQSLDGVSVPFRNKPEVKELLNPPPTISGKTGLEPQMLIPAKK